MKIVDLETFVDYPAGILYSKYDDGNLGPLKIKMESCKTMGGSPIDWFEIDISECISQDYDGAYLQLHDVMKMAENGASIDVDLDTTCRDGEFEQGPMFMVWEQKDLDTLRFRLEFCVGAQTPKELLVEQNFEINQFYGIDELKTWTKEQLQERLDEYTNLRNHDDD